MAKGLVASLFVAAALVAASPAAAGVDIAPYASVKSTKKIKADRKDKSKETETVKQRNEYGIRAGIGFWRLLKAQASIGQSKLTTTEKTQNAKDQYGQIDYQKDLNMSTDDPEREIKIIETQNVGKLTLVVDPSFWKFIVRAKAGVTARQRILETEQTGGEATTLVDGPRYGMHSGFGLGFRLSSRAYFIAEYGFEHYEAPKIEPFEREVTVSFAISMGKGGR